ncbi:hypothetical protein AB3Y40_02495 [Yoonia sp. R2331]|uniref:hypothetical protein n=1 Tax=Yoonia sp. R2331 TaxID=3237238 RepID=UPI0034E37839
MNMRNTALLTSALALATAFPAAAQDGFAISLNGDAIIGDPVVVDTVRRTDVALANADVQVVFDGLGADPRLDVELVGDPGRAGDQITLQSALNYPAFVQRGEIRVIDRAALGGARTVATVPVDPNGQVALTLPEGDDLVVVHRVYDAQGRFDETAPLSVMRTDTRGLAEGVEDGSDSARRRGIPVSGGAVTVSGADVAPGARVVALGEVVPTDGSGGFVIQRILPPGDYGVDVSVNGAGRRVDLTRDITIPNAEWFYVATADLTFGIREGDSTTGRETYQTGRVAGFFDGKTAGGTRITGSLDTGEGDLDQIFRRLDERDPRQLLLRVDPADLYPTYGDDSTIEDRTPTSGKLFLRIEREANYLQWGDFDSDLGDNRFVQNDRSLYGLSAGLATSSVTPAGEARAALTLYAAQPDMLPQRDIFLGTGGTVFFLEKQDIAQASESLSIQLRDPDTGRVIDTQTLIAGEDYAINYIQGIVTLTRPIEASASDGLFSIGSARDADVVLVAAYEHTPTAGDVDGFAYGGRAEGWVTDNLRFGVSGMLDETGVTDHRVVGADLLLALSDNSFVKIEYAESEGTGFDSTFSADGGLIVNDIAASGDAGQAVKIEAQADLAELGLGSEGVVNAYYEERTAGFSSLDLGVTSDETLYGLSADVKLLDRLTLLVGFDHYENEAGVRTVDGTWQLAYEASDQWEYAVGVEVQDNTGGTNPGSRTDVAAKVTYRPSDDASVYVFGQATVDVVDLPENNRYGVGGTYAFANGWAVAGEVSDGDLGVGGRITASRDDGNGNTRYLGYELEPGRDLNGLVLNGRDRGRFVAGGTQSVSSTVDMFGENTYDLFGRHRSLTSAYGLTYAPNDALSITTALEFGRVDDGDLYDFERQALTLGVVYEDDQLSASGRVEYRVEDGLQNGLQVNADTLLVSANAAYKIDEERRLVFSADLARSQTDQSTLVDGNYADVVLGYAFRPTQDDKLNVLARYRYLYDLYGLRDASDDSGIRQRSHVVSLDATYDLNPQWTLGGKVGYRSSQTLDADGNLDAANDAWLAAASARWHVVKDWDALIEVRQLNLVDAGTSESSALGAVYKSLNANLKVGVGYNFGSFSDDLTDLTRDDQGAFLNIIAQF